MTPRLGVELGPHWVVPENIHTHTTGGISEFRRGGGGYVDWNSEGEGGYVDWNSEDMGGLIGLELRRHTGVFRRVNFQFVVVKSLQEKLVKNDLSKDDDSLVNTRHVQLNQHAGDTFQWSWSIKCVC